MLSVVSDVNSWLSKVFATVAAGGVLAGVSGLIIAGSMRADVNTVKERTEKDHEKVNEMAAGMAALEAQVEEIKDQVAGQRREQREDNRDLDQKLDRILERLPPS